MSSPQQRKTFNNLAAGFFFGALAGGGGTAVILGGLGVWMALSAATNWLALGYFLVQSVAAIILACLLGAVAGLLVAVVDAMAGGRLHDGWMPFWMWWLIGGALGALAAAFLQYALTIDYSPSRRHLTSGMSFYPIMGTLCGLVAGPVFGLLYRHQQKVEA
jgi:integral membrane sensor domain MASE1